MGVTREVIELAARQGGLVSRAQLLELGHSPGTVDWLVRSEVITVITSGMYRMIPPKDHGDLVRGACLALPDAVVSHQSAAHLLRFPKLPELVATVSVPSHTTHRFPGVIVRRCDDLAPSDIVRVEGLAITGVTRTFFDLARLLRFKEFDAIGESLIMADRMGLGQFAEVTQRLARRGKAGSRAAWDFLRIRGGGDIQATVLERKGRAILSSAGLPTAVPEFPIPWRPRRRFDDAYPDERVAIEWDSRAWHIQRAAMAADRRRDREAAAQGWMVLRFTWDDVRDEPDEIVDTVTTVLADRHLAVGSRQ